MKRQQVTGWDCFDDEGNRIAWFLYFDDAVLWLTERQRKLDEERAKDHEQSNRK